MEHCAQGQLHFLEQFLAAHLRGSLYRGVAPRQHRSGRTTGDYGACVEVLRAQVVQEEPRLDEELELANILFGGHHA